MILARMYKDHFVLQTILVNRCFVIILEQFHLIVCLLRTDTHYSSLYLLSQQDLLSSQHFSPRVGKAYEKTVT